MTRRLTLLLFIAVAAFARGQTVINGNNQCALIDATGFATVGLQVTGTFSMTLQPEVSIAAQTPVNTTVTPSTSSTPQATVTATGAYVASVGGYTTFLLCSTSYVSGSATIYFQGNSHVNAKTSGSGSGTINSCGGAGNAYYSAGGTTVSCDTSVTDNGTGTLGATIGNITTVNATTVNGTTVNSTNNPIEPYATDTGAANGIVITVPGIPAALTLGTCVRWKSNATSSGATTITITPTGQSAYAATNLMKRVTGGVAALGASGDHVSGGMYRACYDGTQFVLDTTSSTVYTGGALTSAGIVTGNAANQVQGSSTMTMSGGVFTKINNIAATGDGTPAIRAVVTAVSQTAAISTATLCAAATCGNAAAGQYHVHIDLWGSGTACGTPSPGGVTPTLTWTDENAVTHSAVVIPMMSQTGATTMAVNVTAPTVAFQSALANEGGSGDMTISTNGTIIQYSTAYAACGAGTGTYNIRLTVTAFNT